MKHELYQNPKPQQPRCLVKIFPVILITALFQSGQRVQMLLMCLLAHCEGSARLTGTQTKLILEIKLISARQCLINVAAVKKIDFSLSV